MEKTTKQYVPVNVIEYHGRWKAWCPFIRRDFFADSKEEVIKMVAEDLWIHIV